MQKSSLYISVDKIRAKSDLFRNFFRRYNRHYEKIGNNPPDCIEEKLPFEIPNNWTWIRLSYVIEVARGGSPRPIEQYLTKGDGYNWIKIGDTVKGEKYINSTKEKIIAEGLDKTRIVHKGDFLLTNSMSFGRPYILNIDGCIHDGWLVFSNVYKAYDVDFLYYLLSSSFAYHQFCDSASGAVVKNLNRDKVASSFFPLPPHNEQGRIASYIEELFAYIDTIDNNQAELEKLYDDLKKRVLDLAIQGKLVPQEPTDEPAKVLLEKIRAEKKTKLGKKYVDSFIYKGDDNCYYEHIDGIAEDKPVEVQFDLPDGWVWSRIQNISESFIGLTYKPNDIVKSGGSIVLRSSNIQDGKLDLSDIVRVNTIIPDRLIVQKNDIIICARNGSKKLVGKSAIVDEDIPNLTFGAFMAICKTPFYPYVYTFLQSNLFFSQLLQVSGTTTINQLTQNSFNTFLIPLPPLAEQQRIVDKINEIFANL